MKETKKWVIKGSMTVEMSFLMPMILFLIMGSILAVFYFHDKNIMSAAAYETAVVGSTKAREEKGVGSGELNALYQERIRGKCILFAGSSSSSSVGKEQIEVTASASKGRFRISVRQRAAFTCPEEEIRDQRRRKELIDGAKDHN